MKCHTTEIWNLFRYTQCKVWKKLLKSHVTAINSIFSEMCYKPQIISDCKQTNVTMWCYFKSTYFTVFAGGISHLNIWPNGDLGYLFPNQIRINKLSKQVLPFCKGVARPFDLARWCFFHPVQPKSWFWMLAVTRKSLCCSNFFLLFAKEKEVLQQVFDHKIISIS